MFEKIRERYGMYYITDAQLERYVDLSVISPEQAEEIRGSRNMEKITKEILSPAVGEGAD